MAILCASRPCNGDCFNCPYPDCVRSGAEVLKMEAMNYGKKYRRLVGDSSRYDTSWIPSGKEIRAIRGNMSADEFGRLLGVNRSTVYHWESGDRVPSNENGLKLIQMREAEP